MIEQEEVDNIIMLCNIVEKGAIKCAQYWRDHFGPSQAYDELVEVKNLEASRGGKERKTGKAVVSYVGRPLRATVSSSCL